MTTALTSKCRVIGRKLCRYSVLIKTVSEEARAFDIGLSGFHSLLWWVLGRLPAANCERRKHQAAIASGPFEAEFGLECLFKNRFVSLDTFHAPHQWFIGIVLRCKSVPGEISSPAAVSCSLLSLPQTFGGKQRRKAWHTPPWQNTERLRLFRKKHLTRSLINAWLKASLFCWGFF